MNQNIKELEITNLKCSTWSFILIAAITWNSLAEFKMKNIRNLNQEFLCELSYNLKKSQSIRNLVINYGLGEFVNVFH